MNNYVDLFSGIGGFHLGARWAGMQFDKTYFSEVDDYAIKVYKKNFPEAIELGDIRNVDYEKLPKGNWYVSGGFPCQPHSFAGQRKIADDERDLWPECKRVLCELRPGFALFENVPGLFTSDRGHFFNRVLSDIYESGYDAEWQVISAASIGAPHVRKRVWIVAYPAGKRLYKNEQEDCVVRACGKNKPGEWAAYKSITARDYKLEYPPGYENYLARSDDGVPGRVERARIKCLGNSIVPQIAEYLWKRIKDVVWVENDN